MSKRRMLIAYSATATHVQTTLDYLLMLQQHLGFDAEFVHVTHEAILDFDINDYDVVFNNYCSRHCFEGYVSEDFRNALKRFRGLKVLAVQDEYDRTDTLKAAILDLGFHVVLTCVPQASLDYVYPRAEFGHVQFMTVFTGYVPESLIERARVTKPLAERPIVAGYRGRDIGGKYGRLGFDKFEIGRRMKEECDARGVVCDIAMDENSRIYGTAWFDFIENCRSMLGSESGSNVFDFDGSLEKKYKKLSQQNNGRAPTYAEFEPYIAARDNEINMGQISPRVFECAAMRTAMVLYRGRYSDVIEPDLHYIALEKDFSNVEEVLARLENLPALEAMTTRAYDDLIGSGRYTYAAFCAGLREVIDGGLAKLKSERTGFGQAAQRGQARAGNAFCERPTLTPQTMTDFYDKARRAAALDLDATVRRRRPVVMDSLQRMERSLRSAQQWTSAGQSGDDQVASATQLFDDAISAARVRWKAHDDKAAELHLTMRQCAAQSDFLGQIRADAALARLQTDFVPEIEPMLQRCTQAYSDAKSRLVSNFSNDTSSSPWRRFRVRVWSLQDYARQNSVAAVGVLVLRAGWRRLPEGFRHRAHSGISSGARFGYQKLTRADFAVKTWRRLPLATRTRIKHRLSSLLKRP